MCKQGVRIVALPVPGRPHEVDEWADLQVGTREQLARPALDTIVEEAQKVIIVL